jgi:hypothetical protein
VAAALSAWPAQAQRGLADAVLDLTRESRWQQGQSVRFAFQTFHPQGLVRIGDTIFVSSVEVRTPTQRFAQPVDGYDRDAGAGVGHLFKVDAQGRLLKDLVVGESTLLHPGGIDYDGTAHWVPVAEYRPNSRSIIYKVDPETMTATEVVRVADHIGGVVHDIDGQTLHGISWGSRRFYTWRLDASGRVTNGDAPLESLRTPNPSHYVDYQDCQYAGGHRMLCTGVAELRPPGAPAFRLGGLELVDLVEGRPVHQVPVPLWTASGLDMTHNPSWFEATPAGLKAWFLPEDDTSILYLYEVAPR